MIRHGTSDGSPRYRRPRNPTRRAGPTSAAGGPRRARRRQFRQQRRGGRRARRPARREIRGVLVHPRGVDVPVSRLQRRADRLDAGLAAQVVRSESGGRDLGGHGVRPSRSLLGVREVPLAGDDRAGVGVDLFDDDLDHRRAVVGEAPSSASARFIVQKAVSIAERF